MGGGLLDIGKTLLRLLQCRTGNFSMIFALLALPLAGSLAAAYDYAMLSILKGDLVAAVDAALPMVMMDMAKGRKGDPDAIARDAILANLDLSDETELKVHLVIKRSPQGRMNGMGVEATLAYAPVTGPLVDILNGNDAAQSAWIIQIP
jgi:hypothetical protein